jgi:hypothetical protein
MIMNKKSKLLNGIYIIISEKIEKILDIKLFPKIFWS